MVGWHHKLSGHEFEQTLGDSEGQGSLVCCSPWGHKESDTTEQLNNNIENLPILKSINLGHSIITGQPSAVLELRIYRCKNLGLEKAGEPDIKLSTFIGSQRKQGNSRKNIYLCFIDYMEAFGCGIHNKLWKILKEMGLPDHLPCLLRNLYESQEATVRSRHGITRSKLGKDKAVYCHPDYLMYMQSPSSKMLFWMNHKLESRFL